MALHSHRCLTCGRFWACSGDCQTAGGRCLGCGSLLPDWERMGESVDFRHQHTEKGNPVDMNPEFFRGSLTFDEFQVVNVRRCSEAFKHELGAWSLLEWAGAMCGEAGEAANVAKKIKRRESGCGGDWAKRRDPDMETLRAKLADEIGDAVAYLALMAAAAGLDLGTCAARKFDAISDEAGWSGPRLLAAAPADSTHPAPAPKEEVVRAAKARMFDGVLAALESAHNRALPFGQVLADLGLDKPPLDTPVEMRFEWNPTPASGGEGK